MYICNKGFFHRDEMAFATTWRWLKFKMTLALWILLMVQSQNLQEYRCFSCQTLRFSLGSTFFTTIEVSPSVPLPGMRKSEALHYLHPMQGGAGACSAVFHQHTDDTATQAVLLTPPSNCMLNRKGELATAKYKSKSQWSWASQSDVFFFFFKVFFIFHFPSSHWHTNIHSSESLKWSFIILLVLKANPDKFTGLLKSSDVVIWRGSGEGLWMASQNAFNGREERETTTNSFLKNVGIRDGSMLSTIALSVSLCTRSPLCIRKDIWLAGKTKNDAMAWIQRETAATLLSSITLHCTAY